MEDETLGPVVAESSQVPKAASDRGCVKTLAAIAVGWGPWRVILAYDLVNWVLRLTPS